MRKILFTCMICLFFIAACGDGTPQAAPSIVIQESTPETTPTATIVLERPTNTPVPTAYQWWPTSLPEATPRQVTVSRINDSVDPTQNLLLRQGERVPALVLTDIDGAQYQLDALQGKAVLINFWTVGCGSCFYEFPLLEEARQHYTDDELVILAVNVSDLAEETRGLASALGITYPMFVDPDGDIFQHYFGGAVVPTSYFVATDGTVIDNLVGPMDTHILNEYLVQMGLDPMPSN